MCSETSALKYWVGSVHGELIVIDPDCIELKTRLRPFAYFTFLGSTAKSSSLLLSLEEDA
jgi:hypothetical protein